MDWTLLLALCLPWLALGVYAALIVRDPLPLPGPPGHAGAAALSLSVVVPARNEAHNITACLESLVASDYPDFEIIVVDDRSEDGTGPAARAIPSGRARRVTVVDGEAVPPGWFGKQWACWQGVERATGDLLLFTDADTVHEPGLMARAVSGLEREDADCLTVIGRQIMGSFWERLVQPQVFALLAFRYPRMGAEPLPRRRWRSAIANGQYLLFRREAYERIGRHGEVRWEAAEDLRLAQRLVRLGGRLVVRSAYEDFGTRMYRGLRELVAGWSKNMMQAGLQTIPSLLRPVAPPLMMLSGVAAWLLPPVVLVAALLGWGGSTQLAWSALVTGFCVVFWAAWAVRFRGPWWGGLLYPLGSLVGLWILWRSWTGRRRVVWKGRSYAWDVYADVRADASEAQAEKGDSRTE